METCSEDDCYRDVQSKGLCSTHYKRAWRADNPNGSGVACKIDGCSRPHQAKGFCQSHYDTDRYSGERQRAAKSRANDWYHSNKERAAVINKTYYEANKKAHQLRNKEWERKNPEAVRAKKARRRQRENINISNEARKQSILKRIELKNYPCVYCGEYTDEMHIDHALPLCRGGLDIAGNLLQSCRSCNVRKNTKTAEEFTELLETERVSAYVERVKEQK